MSEYKGAAEDALESLKEKIAGDKNSTDEDWEMLSAIRCYIAALEADNRWLERLWNRQLGVTK